MASTRLVLWRAYDPDVPHARTPGFHPLSGEGASFASGRWHTKRPGRRIVYASEHSALAYLELLARAGEAIQRVAFVQFEVYDPVVLRPPDDVLESVHEIAVTRRFGDDWYDHHPAPVLEIPSVILPLGMNYAIRVGERGARLKELAREIIRIDDRLRARLIG